MKIIIKHDRSDHKCMCDHFYYIFIYRSFYCVRGYFYYVCLIVIFITVPGYFQTIKIVL